MRPAHTTLKSPKASPHIQGIYSDAGSLSGPQSSSFSVCANRTSCFTKLGLVKTKPRLSLETVNGRTGCKINGCVWFPQKVVGGVYNPQLPSGVLYATYHL